MREIYTFCQVAAVASEVEAAKRRHERRERCPPSSAPVARRALAPGGSEVGASRSGAGGSRRPTECPPATSTDWTFKVRGSSQ